MKILILGAGQVGRTLAEDLVREGNDVTVVDTDTHHLHELQNRIDIRTVAGYASHPDVLKQAGAENADMLIAVTNSDETNIVGCRVAHTLFQTPTKIARIRANNYMANTELMENKAFAIDVCISPEKLVTEQLEQLIEYPGAAQVLDFAEGHVQLVGVKPHYGGPLVGQTIEALREALADTTMNPIALLRRDRSIPISNSTILEVNDSVYFVVAPQDTNKVLHALGRLNKPYKHIMIAGGGRIGELIAASLENKYAIKIIEQDAERCSELASCLNKSIVLHGNAVDRDLLLNENIDQIDVFCAVTNDDEANIMSCLQAKRLGARHTIALINRTAYTELIEGNGVDHAICPQETTIGTILTRLRQGDVAKAYALRRGAMEAIEVIAHGDKNTSKVVGKKLQEIDLPKDTIIGAIVRKEELIIANDDIVIEPEDHVILLVVNKRYIHDVEKLFQVSVNFIG